MAQNLFPGFTRQFLETGPDCSIFVRAKLESAKPPLLLLHGYPQTHVEYMKVVPKLLPHFSIVLMDLRGYGASSTVPSTSGSGYSKRLMAQDCVSVMKQLGYNKFTVVGHDRGARVAYRLALDSPDCVEKLVVIDIIPTYSMYSGFGDVGAALRAYHWLFLAQPEPFPEKMIQYAEGGRLFLEHTLASWTGAKDLTCFAAVAMDEYRKAFCSETRIHSTCEDYRAGALIDKVYDEEDLSAGRKIEAPLLAVWGEVGVFAEGLARKAENTISVWQKYAKNVTGKGLGCGHFVTEEDPEGLTEALLDFLL